MDSLVGYGSDDEIESERYGGHIASVGGHGGQRRRDDDTNYDDVNMDMSEDSQEAESEPELPPAEPAPTSRHSSRDGRRGSDDSRSRDRSRDRNRSRESDRDRKDRRRESPPRVRAERDRPDRERPDRERPDRERPDRERPDRERADRDRADRHDRRSPRRDDRYRSDRNDRGRGYEGNSRRGLLGDRPDDRTTEGKVPALMDLKPFGGEPPPEADARDTRDAVSPRFAERDRRDRDRGDRERDRDRHSRRSDEGRSSSHRHGDRRERSRSRSRGAAFPPPPAASSSSGERRGSPPSGDYRPSSYKVNKKLEVMEKMGLQIKTPDGSMATAAQLRAAADAPRPHHLPPGALNAAKILDQVAKRKLLWAHKRAPEVEAPAAAQWSGARFAQDNDGRQASKFMRLMGIKEAPAVKPETPASGEPMRKQEELFQAMQAQYDVARAATHTMRGVGLGFSRGQY